MTDTLVQLCGATVPCYDHFAPSDADLKCANCIDSTGRVYLLPDSVRAEVDGDGYWHSKDCSGRRECTAWQGMIDCEGRGWVPTEDAWVLLDALAFALARHHIEVEDDPSCESLRLGVWRGRELFLSAAVERVLALLGAKLGE